MASSTTTSTLESLGIDMSSLFAKPGVGTKTPTTPKALKIKCQSSININLGLPDLPSIYMPKFPPALPKIPIPTSLPLGPCTVSIDLACLGIPDDVVQIAIKYIIIPIAGGIIPPTTEAAAKVLGGKIVGLIEDAQEYSEKYRRIQQILNNLSLDEMFGFDAIPCPDLVAKAKAQAKADALAAKKREEEGTLTREDIWNKYSDAILSADSKAKSYNLTTIVTYSSIRTGKAITFEIVDDQAYKDASWENSFSAMIDDIYKEINDWNAKYKTS